MTESAFITKLKRVISSDPTLSEANVATRAGLDNSTIRKAFQSGHMSSRSQEKIVTNVFGMTLAEFMSQDRPQSTDEELRTLFDALEPDERLRLLGYGQALIAQRSTSED